MWDVLNAYVGCNRMGTATAAGDLLTGGRLSIAGLGGTSSAANLDRKVAEPDFPLDGTRRTVVATI